MSQHATLVIEDRAALRGHRHGAITLRLGFDGELLAARDLEEPESGEQPAEERDHDHAHDHQPGAAVDFLPHRLRLGPRKVPQSRRPPPSDSRGGIPHHGEHDRGDQGVEQGGDEHGLEPSGRQEALLTHHGAHGDEEEAAEQAAETAEDRGDPRRRPHDPGLEHPHRVIR